MQELFVSILFSKVNKTLLYELATRLVPQFFLNWSLQEIFLIAFVPSLAGTLK